MVRFAFLIFDLKRLLFVTLDLRIVLSIWRVCLRLVRLNKLSGNFALRLEFFLRICLQVGQVFVLLLN